MLSRGVLMLLTHVTFQLPPGTPVVGAEVYVASDLSRPRQTVEVTAGAAGLAIAFVPGRESVVLLRRRDGAYYLHGPFRWPSDSQSVAVDGHARRTVEGRLSFAGTGSRPAWIDPDGVAVGEWPRCRVAGPRWQCVGVPLDAAGAVVLRFESPVVYAAVRPARGGGMQEVPVRAARWATIVTLDGAREHAETADLRLLAPRSTPFRGDAARVMLAAAAGAGVERISARSYLVAGAEHRDDLLLQVSGEHVSLTRVPLATAAAGLLQPTTVLLAPATVTRGRVVDRAGDPAAGARLALAEIVEGPGADGRPRTLRRQVAELVSGGEGEFTLSGLGSGRFELLALHPRLGRGTLAFEPGPQPLLLRLEPGRRVAGRVLRSGVPRAGVAVDVPASHEGYVAAADPMDVLAPAGVTGADGRFLVALPQRGGTELRLDDGGVVTRVPLPPLAAGQLADLGDVVLRGPVDVRVTYVGDERCALVASGPLGHTGMTLAEAQIVGPGTRLLTLPESGRWLLELRCPRGAARPEPAVLDVPPQAAEWSAHVMMAPP